jgi:hypothetical protein
VGWLAHVRSQHIGSLNSGSAIIINTCPSPFLFPVSLSPLPLFPSSPSQTLPIYLRGPRAFREFVNEFTLTSLFCSQDLKKKFKIILRGWEFCAEGLVHIEEILNCKK